MPRILAQAIALQHPCLLGGETAHPRFAWWVIPDRVSLVLTINRGYE